MMSVNSVTNPAGRAYQTGGGGNLQNDSVSKNIQNQIRNAQKQLQEIGADKNLTPDEKVKKRQEIQQEIATLNQQLQQHQAEKRKAQQEQRAAEKADRQNSQSSQKEQTAAQNTGISRAGMQAMLSADTSLKQAKVQGNVANRMENRADVLKAEIKQDGGQDTSAKEAELAEMQQKAETAQAAQMSTLAEANQTLTDAAKTKDTETKEADATEAKTENSGKKGSETETAKAENAVAAAARTMASKKGDIESAMKLSSGTGPETTSPPESLPAESATASANPSSVIRKHVDIRL